MARFYTNPFVKDAPAVVQVSASEPRYDGVTMTRDGTYRSWSRQVTYSDGTVRTEEVRRESLGDFEFAFLVGGTRGVAIPGRKMPR